MLDLLFKNDLVARLFMTSKVLIREKFYIKNFWGGNCPPCPPAMYGHDRSLRNSVFCVIMFVI